MNNNRSFFLDNRDWYDQAVKEPMYALIEALAPTINKIDGELDTRPNRAMARPMRDVRTLHGRPPYRDYSFMKFRRLGQSRYSTLGFFFDISDEGASYGMGIYDKNVPLMNALRREIEVDPKRVLRLTKRAEKAFTLHPNTIRRMKVPPDVPPPLAAWYPMRAFHMQRVIDDFSLIKSPRLVDEIISGLGALTPLYQFIQALTPIEEII